MSRPQSRRIAVVGGGPAGIAAAAFLADGGHDVALIEQAPSLRETGAGLMLQPAGLDVLDRLGLARGLIAMGGPVLSIDGRNEEGKTVLDLDYRRLHPLAFGLGIQRRHLFEALVGALSRRPVTITCGRRVVDSRLDAAGRWLIGEDGDIAGPFDLVIDASGWQSALRAKLGEIERAKVFPYGALWALFPDPEPDRQPVLAQRYRAGREMIGLLPVGAGEDGQPLLAFFYSVRHDAMPALRAAGIDAFKARIEALWPEAARVIAPLADLGALFPAAYGDTVLHRWHGERLLFIGDAAHAMSPQLGQGVNLGLVDALTIATLLAIPGALPERLSAFTAERRASLGFYQRVSRWITPVFQGEYDRLMPLRDELVPLLCRAPWTGRQMVATLAGAKTGWLGWRLPAPETMAHLRAAARI